jgi:hypothetical protein
VLLGDEVFTGAELDRARSPLPPPPPDGVEYTAKGYNPDTNLIQAVEIPVEEPVVEPPQPGASENMSSAQDPDNPYSKDNIQKLFDDTRNLEQMFKQRNKNLNSAANQ